MKNKSGINVIILAAGEGTRLRPFTLDRPKCLVDIDGRSLLDRHLDILQASQVGSIVLVGGYMVDKLKGKKAKLKVNPRFAETNMVWTLFCAEDELMEGAIVAYGDIVYSKEVLMQLLDSKADIAVAVDLDWESYWRARNEDPLSDAETLKMDGDGRILELGETPTSIEEIEGQYMGLMKFTETGAQTLRDIYRDACQAGNLGGKPAEKAYMTDLIQAVIDAGHRVQSVPVHGGWVEVDSISDLKLPLTQERLGQIYK